ncbi:hypothetical protein QIG56_28380, partial [Klebsiella pneumoniae]|nr:hypothetical protein [Klebsiella pneumoniae]
PASYRVVRTKSYLFNKAPAELQLIERLIHQRSKARRMGEWDKADRLRNELAEQGIELEDVGENTSWRFR